MIEEFISFVISTIPITVRCQDCGKFITQGRHTVLMSRELEEQDEIYFVGEIRYLKCCNNEQVIPIIFPSETLSGSYAKAQFSICARKDFSEIKKNLHLTSPTEEFLETLYGLSEKTQSVEFLYSDQQFSDNIQKKEGVGFCHKKLH